MSRDKLILYYKYYIPITVIQMLTSIALINFLSVADYGAFTLYLSNINMLFFLTFGIQNGYMLKYRNQSISNCHEASNANNLMLIISILLTIIAIVIGVTFDINKSLILAFVSASATAVFIVQKAIHRSVQDIDHLNRLTLSFRLILVLDIVAYVNTGNLQQMLLIDSIYRYLLVILSSIQINYIYSKFKSKYTFNSLINLSKSGFLLMIGNWLVSLFLLFDKYALAGDENSLGMYSFAITVVLLTRVLIAPISELMFVTIDKEISEDKLYKNIRKVLICLMVVTALIFIASYICFEILGLFSKYQSAYPIVGILLAAVPLVIITETTLINLNKLHNGRKFLYKTCILAAIVFVTYFGYVAIASSINLILYSIITVINYILIFTAFSYDQIGIKKTVKLLSLYTIFFIIYFIVIQVLY